jgi:hypothetical protein
MTPCILLKANRSLCQKYDVLSHHQLGLSIAHLASRTRRPEAFTLTCLLLTLIIACITRAELPRGRKRLVFDQARLIPCDDHIAYCFMS